MLQDCARVRGLGRVPADSDNVELSLAVAAVVLLSVSVRLAALARRWRLPVCRRLLERRRQSPECRIQTRTWGRKDGKQGMSNKQVYVTSGRLLIEPEVRVWRSVLIHVT